MTAAGVKEDLSISTNEGDDEKMDVNQNFEDNKSDDDESYDDPGFKMAEEYLMTRYWNDRRNHTTDKNAVPNQWDVTKKQALIVEDATDGKVGESGDEEDDWNDADKDYETSRLDDEEVRVNDAAEQMATEEDDDCWELPLPKSLRPQNTPPPPVDLFMTEKQDLVIKKKSHPIKKSSWKSSPSSTSKLPKMSTVTIKKAKEKVTKKTKTTSPSTSSKTPKKTTTSLKKSTGKAKKSKTRTSSSSTKIASTSSIKGSSKAKFSKKCICDECEFSCSSTYNLTRHKRSVHQKCYPPACPICSQCFGEKYHVFRHLATVHSRGSGENAGKSGYFCAFCAFKINAKSGKEKQMLQKHITAEHSDEVKVFTGEEEG